MLPHPLETCSICLERSQDCTITPCGHVFHLACLSEIIRPICPICRGDLTSFLQSNGVSEQTIIRRVSDDEMRICYEEMQDIDPETLTTDEFVVLCKQATIGHNKNEWYAVYRDILLDQISNARPLFCNFSEKRYTQRHDYGVFFYMTSVEEFVRASHTRQRVSEDAAWVAQHDVRGTQYESVVRSLCERVKISPSKSFGVCLVIIDDDNVPIVTTTLIPMDSEGIALRISKSTGGGYVSGIRRSRIAYQDILKSLLKCGTCRCSGASIGEPNPEYDWANMIQSEA